MSAWWAWLAAWIAWVTVWSTLLPLNGRSRFVRAGWGVGVAVLAWIPVHGLPLLSYQRGWIGDLSITTTLLLVTALARRFVPGTRIAVRLSGPERRGLLAVIAAVSGVVYPMALGLTPFDPYRLGYGDPIVLVGLFVVAAFFWARGWLGAALILAFGVFAHSLELLESTNLWDYLIDPLLALYAWGALICAWRPWTRLRRVKSTP